MKVAGLAPAGRWSVGFGAGIRSIRPGGVPLSSRCGRYASRDQLLLSLQRQARNSTTLTFAQFDAHGSNAERGKPRLLARRDSRRRGGRRAAKGLGGGARWRGAAGRLGGGGWLTSRGTPSNNG
jgi:hypothetical protein